MSTSIKEKPIICSVEEVRAILDNKKHILRRVIKPQPSEYSDIAMAGMIKWKHLLTYPDELKRVLPLFCPYGQVGDRLWVRETFMIESDIEDEPTDRPFKNDYEWGLLKPHYKATDANPELYDEEDRRVTWRSPLYMPRWASRITLEITNIRVERLQEITPKGLFAEGLPNEYENYALEDAIQWFMQVWNSLNAKRGYSWESNPWAWVIEFKKV